MGWHQRLADSLIISLPDHNMEVSSREDRNQKEGREKMKLNDIVEMWNEISEDMVQAHQL